MSEEKRRTLAGQRRRVELLREAERLVDRAYHEDVMRALTSAEVPLKKWCRCPDSIPDTTPFNGFDARMLLDQLAEAESARLHAMEAGALASSTPTANTKP